MTVPATNWCPSCESTCSNHSRICTVCGSSLVVAPPLSVDTSSNRASTTSVDLIPRSIHDSLGDASREIRTLLNSIRAQIELTGQAQQQLLDDLRNDRQDWQTIPAALLDPQGGQLTNGNRPTSKKTLQDIPRITLQKNSSLFRQANIRLYGRELCEMNAIPGEFGPAHEMFKLMDAAIVVATPRTGRGGLSDDTMKLMKAQSKDVIMYLERGDGLTFVQKALYAQQAGAVAVVIGNNVSNPWPYIMADSTDEARRSNLTIPVVMVKLTDSRAIVDCCPTEQTGVVGSCSLEIKPQMMDCVVCTDPFQIGQTLIRLPVCGHVFHESCALQWLEKHNTCLYCRLELPTDDQEYERERRRVQRTHAGSDRLRSHSPDALYR